MSRILPRYPIYIPSRGRWAKSQALTIRTLKRNDVPFRLVVEPAQADEYRQWIGPRDQLLVLPGDDYGSAIFARNWMRDHAEAEGHARHWQLDDNISMFYRSFNGERVPVHPGVALRLCEDLTDRYENIGISGLAYTMFVPRTVEAPYFRNVHVYSMMLINHAMPCRNRLRYNDDTDICLQALTHGWATLLVNAMNGQKLQTMTSGGGYTENYREGQGDGLDSTDTFGRYEMARILEREWPGLVKTIRRFNRYQHSVNWRAFGSIEFVPRDGFDDLPAVDEYDLELVQVREIKSPRVEAFREQFPSLLAAATAFDDVWRGLPAFVRGSDPLRLIVRTNTDEQRERLVEQLGVRVSKRTRGTVSAWWPPRPMSDFASLVFVPSSYEREDMVDDDFEVVGDGSE